MKFRDNTIKNTADHMLMNVLICLVAVELYDAAETFVVRFDSILEITLVLCTDRMAVE